MSRPFAPRLCAAILALALAGCQKGAAKDGPAAPAAAQGRDPKDPEKDPGADHKDHRDHGASDKDRKDPKDPVKDHKDEEKEHEELPSRVRLGADVLKAAGIRFEPARRLALPLTVDLVGEVAADPDRTARVTARVPGRIAEVHFREGQSVKAGDLLAVIESPELARARAAYLSAAARAAAAQRNAERTEEIGRSGLASGQELQAAQAEARSLQAEAAAAERALQSFGLSAGEIERGGARLPLRAPISGAVSSRSAIVGQTVGAEATLGEIVDLSRAYFLGRLFEKNLARARAGHKAEVRLNAYPGEVFLGAVESIGKQLDPAARTVVARIAIADRDGLLKVDLFGSARLSSEEAGAPVLAAPLTAVTRIAERDVVFVRQADGDFEVHPVTTGRSAGGMVEIIAGLREGEQVVVEGVFSLKSAVLKGTFGEED